MATTMSQSLENALIDPDDNAACHTLHQLLIRKTTPASPARPATAKAYLEAFCDQRRHVIRRRWTGLLLARLLESCLDVARHLRRTPDDLFRIGAVILGLNEAEETKIVAGLIIRAGLSQGIKFSDFWSEKKVHATSTLFPTEADTSWMKAFQDYLDTLSGLSPKSSSPKLVLLYPVAFTAADGYRWSPHDENLPLLLIESHMLTIITPASALHEIEFVYIPFGSIKNVRCKPSSPYDSQGGVVPTTPWAVVLEFISIPTPYQVNCSEQSGNEFTVIMETRADAKDCERFINDTVRPQRNTSDFTDTPSPALSSDSNKGKVMKGSTQALSQGGVIMFDRSQREGSIVQGSQQAHQAALKAAQAPRTEAAHSKCGVLPEVKKLLRLDSLQSVPDATLTDFEFPDHSPSIKRPSKSRTKKLPVNRTGNAVLQTSAPNSNTRKPAASKSKLKSQERSQSDADDDQIEIIDKEDVSDPRAHQIEKATEVTKESKPIDKEIRGPQRRQADVFGIPEEMQEDKKGARGTRRTRAVPMTYKEDTSSEEESAASDFVKRERAKTSRNRASRTVTKKEPLSLSPARSATSKRRARKAKAGTRPLQLLKGSLLSNLQPTAVAKRDHKAKLAGAGDEQRGQGKSTVLAETKHKTQAPSAPRQENRSSEAHILGRLNDIDCDDEPGRTNALKNKDSVASRKRTAASITPSTPRFKRAKLDHDEMRANAEVDESMSMKPPSTVAPVRVLQEPSSPCGSRNMQAPPKPVSEEPIRMISPKTNTMVRSRKQLDERQTPVHQLGKRSHSGMSASLELLSSNSKPTPASPRAASTAISGHADQRQVIMEQAQGEYKIEKSDPFRANRRKISEFTRRLTGSTGQQSKPTEGMSQNHPIELGDSPSSASSEALPPPVQSPVTKSSHTGISQPIDILQIRTPKRSRSRFVERSVAETLPTMESPQVHPGYLSRHEASLHDGTPQIKTGYPLRQETSHCNGNRQDHQGAVEALRANNSEIGGDTLVDFEEPPQVQDEAFLPDLRSSPPPMGSPSSHSSTSAESEPKTDPPVTTSQAEEMEWEASLQPYQRDLKDQLLRVSNRVLQHIIDNESAASDIADTYAKDGRHSLDLLFQSHEQEFNAMHKDVKQKKANLNEATEKVLSKLRLVRQTIEDETE
ncbi:hypothetical protein DPSP01_008711 [Paraphaeosphaeria sporulosa]